MTGTKSLRAALNVHERGSARDGDVPMRFFYGCLIALEIEVATVVSGWFTVRLVQVLLAASAA